VSNKLVVIKPISQLGYFRSARQLKILFISVGQLAIFKSAADQLFNILKFLDFGVILYQKGALT
jgi:hypothetical protein